MECADRNAPPDIGLEDGRLALRLEALLSVLRDGGNILHVRA
jgi:hypothetical protein